MSGYEFIQSGNHTHYMAAPSNVGMYEENGEVLLIDSGSDKEAGRQILKFTKQRGWKISLIVNTHSHADHIGGNFFLQKRTNLKIAATELEAPFINHPFLEPSFISGSYPNLRLQNKFIMAKPSRVTDVIESSGPILDTPLEAENLPGHFLQMIGIHTPDNIFFSADSLISEEILEKYHIFYIFDVRGHFKTLEYLENSDHALTIPSHGSPLPDTKRLAEKNRAKMNEIIDCIMNYCELPRSAEDLLSLFTIHYNLEINANQYALLLGTIRSYLAYLLEEKRLTIIYNEGRMKWKIK